MQCILKMVCTAHSCASSFCTSYASLLQDYKYMGCKFFQRIKFNLNIKKFYIVGKNQFGLLCRVKECPKALQQSYIKTCPTFKCLIKTLQCCNRKAICLDDINKTRGHQVQCLSPCRWIVRCWEKRKLKLYNDRLRG